MIENEDTKQLPDAVDNQVEEQKTAEEKEKALVSLWTTRFKQSEDFRRPYIEKNLRMYKLYRAYRDAINYAYNTNLMPPIGFEIIETVKPRIASSKIKVNIYPTEATDKDNKEGISKWDDLVEYNLQEMDFDDQKKNWINAMLMFGNGIAQVMWDGKTASLEIVDNWLFYPDPKAQNRLKNSRWEIKQSFKNIAIIKEEEKNRGEEALYDPNKLDKVEDKQSTGDDPRRERYQINTLKMGQIDDGRQKKDDYKPSRGDQSTDKEVSERTVEIWECFDHVTKKLQVIMNRETVVRDEENPYINILDGRVFIDLVDIALNWEFYAMGHLEPVETTIHEIADSRNQAMDDIVFSLDPVRKVKKGSGYKPEDLKHSPGAIWFLDKADDVVIERMPEVSRAWTEVGATLRGEIQTSLALSEYTQGIPQGSSEPASKVEMLLMQTNIRFSSLVRNFEVALTDLVNAIIQMNQEFLDEDLAMRILGDNFRFSEFKQKDKEMGVDAWVSVDPKKEKSTEQEAKEAVELYDMLVINDAPAEGDEESIARYEKKKAMLQRLIVEKFGFEEYVDVLAPVYKPKPPAPPEPPRELPQPVPQMPTEGMPMGEAGMAVEQPIPLLEPEAPVVEPTAIQNPQGMLTRLFQG